MKQTTALSAEARELIERAHLEPRPSDAACRRMDLELAALLAAGPGSLLLAPSLEQLAEPRIGLAPAASGLWQRCGVSGWGKLSFGAASVALMVGAFWLGRTTSKQSESASSWALLGSVPHVQDAAEDPVGGGLALAPVTMQPTEPAPASAAASNTAASNTAASSAAASSTLPSNTVLPSSAGLLAPKAVAARAVKAVDGITLLGEVELALREGHPRAALRELRSLDAASPPRLQHLARVLRAVALCDAGQLDEGRHLVAELQERRTDSVFAARLERACMTPNAGAH